MDNQHKLVKGYRDLSQSEIDAMNSIKLAEQDIGQLFQQVKALPGVDQRSLFIAKTQLQQAFSWFVRSVAPPLDVYELVIPTETVETFLDRLKVERDELNEKYSRLKDCIASAKFKSFQEDVQADLLLQLEVMEPYVSLIAKRYASFIVKDGV